MNWFNFHTHSHYCDGSTAPYVYIENAIESGFISIGFSGHSPLPFKNEWSIKAEKLNEYSNEIRELKSMYKDKIAVYLGLEMDYIPGISENFQQMRNQQRLEYIIGSVHLVRNPEKKELWFIDGPEKGYMDGLEDVFGNDPKMAVESYYRQIVEMVRKEKPDVIGHFDKVKMHNKDRFFLETDPWYQTTIKETLKQVAASGCIIEVNTRGIYSKKTKTLFPDIPVLELCYSLKIPLTLSSDAHKPGELMNYFSEATDIIKSIGYKQLHTLTQNGWKEVNIY
jgi:histidinol-phosphatase (PHP family)